MMSSTSSVDTLLVVGTFPRVCGIDPNTLELKLTTETRGQTNNIRVACDPFPNSSIYAVSCGFPRDPKDSAVASPRVTVFDFPPRIVTVFANSHHGNISGLSCLRASSGSFDYPRFVTSGGRTFVWNGLNGEMLAEGMRGPTTTWRSLSVFDWNPDEVYLGGELKSAEQSSDSSDLFVYNVARGSVESYQSHQGGVHGIAADVEHGCLLSSGVDRTLKVWSSERRCEREVCLKARGYSVVVENDLLVVGQQHFVEVRDMRKDSDLISRLRITKGRISIRGAKVWDLAAVGDHRCVAVLNSAQANVVSISLAGMPSVGKSLKIGSSVLGCTLLRACQETSFQCMQRLEDAQQVTMLLENEKQRVVQLQNRVDVLEQEGEEEQEISNIERMLNDLSTEERQCLDPSSALSGRGYLDFRDVLFRRPRCHCVLRVVFQGISVNQIERIGVDEVEQESEGEFPYQETIVVNYGVDTTLQNQLAILMSPSSSFDGGNWLFGVEEDLVDVYRGLYRRYTECFSSLLRDDIQMKKNVVQEIARLVGALVERTKAAFGGDDIENIAEECGRRIASSSDDAKTLLGSLIGCGFGRHRSLFLKLLLDKLGIPCQLMSGKFGDSFRVWINARIGDEIQIFDPSLRCSEILLDSSEEYQPTFHFDCPSYDLENLRKKFFSNYPRGQTSNPRKGTYSTVYSVKAKNLVSGSIDELALKVVDMHDIADRFQIDYKGHLKNEIRLLTQMRHPNIVQLYGMFVASHRHSETAELDEFHVRVDVEWTISSLLEMLHMGKYAAIFEGREYGLDDLPYVSDRPELLVEIIPLQCPLQRLLRYVRLNRRDPSRRPSPRIFEIASRGGSDRLACFLQDPCHLEKYVSNFEAEEVIYLDLPFLIDRDLLLESLIPDEIHRGRFVGKVKEHVQWNEVDLKSDVGTRRSCWCTVMKCYSYSARDIVQILRKQLPSHSSGVEALSLLLQVANGLRYLHSISLVHLDLKLENILVQWDEEDCCITEVVLCDFAGSRERIGTYLSISGMFRTPQFCAPEVHERKEESIDHRADIYCFGWVMEHFSEFYDRFPDLSALSLRCRERDPRTRPTILGILYVLKEHLLVLLDRKKKRNRLV